MRRKFADALVVEQEQASYFVEQIQRLYAIERFCRTEGLSADARLDARAQAKPILRVKTRMGVRKRLIALEFKLVRVTHHGILEIDILVESIRPIALGSFAAPEASARPSSTPSGRGYLQSPPDQPLAYLADVLDKLPARTVNNIDDLLPWNWKPDNSMEQLYKM